MISRWQGYSGWPEDFFKPIMVDGVLENALKWPDLTGTIRENKPWLNNLPRHIFVNDMSDSFTPYIWVDGQRMALSVYWLEPYMELMEDSLHRILLLTKQPSRMVSLFKSWTYLPGNFMVGTSITHRDNLNRATVLATLAALKAEGALLWLSLEPLYSEVDLRPFLPYIDWVVIGGESGSAMRVVELNWIWKVIVDCGNAGVPVFVKQFGTRPGYKGKGSDWKEWPDEFRVRQLPA
jgi:protein gp37